MAPKMSICTSHQAEDQCAVAVLERYGLLGTPTISELKKRNVPIAHETRRNTCFGPRMPSNSATRMCKAARL